MTLSKYQILAPSAGTIETLLAATPLAAWNSAALACCRALSSLLLRDEKTRAFPELVALGFWLRDSHLSQLHDSQPEGHYKPLGSVLHIAPNNVDSMFVYSWIVSLLMGNSNIVRVGSKSSAAKTHLLALLNQVLNDPEHQQIAQRNLFISYASDSELTAALSLRVDVRLIWGGDDTVSQVRQLPCQPRCRDIGFAHRWSAAVMDATGFDKEQLASLADRLWRDVKPHGQQACSSPKVLFWLGQKDRLAAFMSELDDLAKQQPAELWTQNEHLVCSQLAQAQCEATVLYRGRMTALEVPRIEPSLFNWHCGDGLLYVIPLNNLAQLVEQTNSRLQTLTYAGVDKSELVKICTDLSITGIDRVVPVGQALDFSAEWDGYELFSQLARRIVIE